MAANARPGRTAQRGMGLTHIPKGSSAERDLIRSARAALKPDELFHTTGTGDLYAIAYSDGSIELARVERHMTKEEADTYAANL